MLALANLLDNAGAGTLPLEALQRAFQGLILTDTDLGPFLSLLSLTCLGISRPYGRMANRTGIIPRNARFVNACCKFSE